MVSSLPVPGGFLHKPSMMGKLIPLFCRVLRHAKESNEIVIIVVAQP